MILWQDRHLLTMRQDGKNIFSRMVYLYSTYNLVTRADSTLETLDDFKNTKIGVVMAGDGELNLKKLNEEHNLGN